MKRIGGAPMLVLSRKVGERLVIGDSVVVTVLSIQGGAIKVGIDAPRAVSVVRSELLPNEGPGDGRSAPPHGASDPAA